MKKEHLSNNALESTKNNIHYLEWTPERSTLILESFQQFSHYKEFFLYCFWKQAKNLSNVQLNISELGREWDKSISYDLFLKDFVATVGIRAYYTSLDTFIDFMKERKLFWIEPQHYNRFIALSYATQNKVGKELDATYLQIFLLSIRCLSLSYIQNKSYMSFDAKQKANVETETTPDSRKKLFERLFNNSIESAPFLNKDTMWHISTILDQLQIITNKGNAQK